MIVKQYIYKPVVPRRLGVGSRFAQLLSIMGIVEHGGCGCEDMQRKMNGWGAECRERMGEILAHLRKQAEERGLAFCEPGARWMVNLAVVLYEQDRGPTTRERIELAAAGLFA